MDLVEANVCQQAWTSCWSGIHNVSIRQNWSNKQMSIFELPCNALHHHPGGHEFIVVLDFVHSPRCTSTSSTTFVAVAVVFSASLPICCTAWGTQGQSQAVNNRSNQTLFAHPPHPKTNAYRKSGTSLWCDVRDPHGSPWMFLQHVGHRMDGFWHSKKSLCKSRASQVRLQRSGSKIV